MALTDRQSARDFLRLPAAGTAQDVLLDALISAADKAIKNYCKRNLETAAYTEYLSGNGRERLALREYPVTTVVMNGTLTTSSAVVTGLSSTVTLLAGMAVSGTGIPTVAGSQPTTILSVDSSTQVTLSANATATGTKSLTFSPALYMDPGGFFGKGVSAFTASSCLQVEGVSYVFDWAPDGTCRSGNIIRLAGGLVGNSFFSGWPWSWRSGSLTARLAPCWPEGYGNCKIVYCAGYGLGPSTSGGTLPADLTEAANRLVAYIRTDAMMGGTVRTEDLQAFQTQAQQRAAAAVSASPELGSLRQILAHYRKLVV